MSGFQELKVWQRAKNLAVFVYQVTQSGTISQDYGICNQMQRAAVSIPSNIAEGDELDTSRQAIKHFYIARGSSAELLTQAIIAKEVNYIDDAKYLHIKDECEAISSVLFKLIKVRSRNER